MSFTYNSFVGHTVAELVGVGTASGVGGVVVEPGHEDREEYYAPERIPDDEPQPEGRMGHGHSSAQC